MLTPWRLGPARRLCSLSFLQPLLLEHTYVRCSAFALDGRNATLCRATRTVVSGVHSPSGPLHVSGKWRNVLLADDFIQYTCVEPRLSLHAKDMKQDRVKHVPATFLTHFGVSAHSETASFAGSSRGRCRGSWWSVLSLDAFSRRISLCCARPHGAVLNRSVLKRSKMRLRAVADTHSSKLESARFQGGPGPPGR